ncbi:sugar phosphate isomerase/epimerase family protein [Phycicoccus flavus]|uniref:sugar phosphate isomerase/epimerase family protein n=1 Tax=Phycicoccus flavus TaxID=2502783 RepID=UPI000FEB5EBA|nr:TIM barrel protein [Phycicoccus flavus]NHA67864.1 sugar phosphate isomerase/epimerase [Phycicoccus flavus]
MCFGFDGFAPLREAAERGTGPDRRSLLRGVGASFVGGAAALAGAGTASAAPGGKGRPVPPGQISIQMYTLRSITNGQTVDSVLGTLSDIGYRKVELAGYYGYTAQQLGALLAANNISASSSHDGLSGSEAAMHAKFENAVTLGQRFINVPYLRSDSADQWRAWAEAMNAEAAVAKTYGLAYGYHNHAHEFSLELDDGSRGWDILTSTLDPALVHLEVDLFWAVTGGLQTGEATEATASRFAADVIAAAPQQTLQYHVKDRDAGADPFAGNAFADVGTGFVDFPLIFGSHMTKEFIVENDRPDIDPITTARVGYDYLRAVRSQV